MNNSQFSIHYSQYTMHYEHVIHLNKIMSGFSCNIELEERNNELKLMILYVFLKNVMSYNS